MRKIKRRFFLKQRRLSYARERRKLWMDHLHILPGPWILVNMESHAIIDVGVHFSQMIGLSRKELEGKHINEIAAQSRSSSWTIRQLDGDLLDMPGRYEDVSLKRIDKDPLLVDVHVSHPLKKNGQVAVICLITDRTERQQLQNELIAKHKELRKAFSDLERQSADLVRLNGELGEMSARLNSATSLAAIGEITAELTHQLNNPLAAAIGAARRIGTLIDQSNNKALTQMMALLNDSHSRLRNTMDELKNVYRTSRSTEGDFESVDLGLQVDSALMLMQQRLQHLNIIVDMPEVLPFIIGRPSQIQHVVVNLIDNAAQSIGKSGTIHIQAKHCDAKVVFLVSDNGPGIPPEQREKVFEPFYTTREQGSGLGLSVVRRNVESNKATIRICTSRYGGAEFEIGFQAVP